MKKMEIEKTGEAGCGKLTERRKIEKLTPLFVERAKKGRAKPGKHCDGRNLYLLVEKNGSARWVHRYFGADGKDHWHGLAPYRDVQLGKSSQKEYRSPRSPVGRWP